MKIIDLHIISEEEKKAKAAKAVANAALAKATGAKP